MMKLVAARVVNWHRMADEAVRFQGSALLFGDTGSGKTTLLDAIQYVLVADERKVLFNRSGNPRSKRTLLGYVLEKLGSENEEQGRTPRYRRDASVSYAMVGFEDEHLPERRFVAGVCFEASRDRADVSKLFFLLHGLDVVEVPAVDGERRSLPAKQFERHPVVMRSELPVLTTSVEDYQRELRQRLGPLAAGVGGTAPFHSLIVKALGHKEVVNVRDFVTSFIADPDPIGTTDLLANLENYQSLERQAKQARERATDLTEVVRIGEALADAKARHTRATFVHQMATAQRVRAELDSLEEVLAQLDRQIAEARAEAEARRHESERLDQERQQIERALAESDAERRRMDLLDKERALLAELDRARTAAGVLAELLADQRAAQQAWVHEELADLRRTAGSGAWRSALGGTEADLSPAARRAWEALKQDRRMTEEDVDAWSEALEATMQDAGILWNQADQASRDLEQEAVALQREQEQLRQGEMAEEPGLTALLARLNTELRLVRPARPLCEYLDVGTDRWRRAAEYALGRRRFHVVVDPADYEAAADMLYGMGKTAPAGIRILDIGRMPDRTPQARSLAEELVITGDDPLIRRVVHYSLANTVKAENAREARQATHRAITPDGFVYGDFALGREEFHARLFLGRGAIEARRAEIRQRLGAIEVERATWGRRGRAAQQARSATSKAYRRVTEVPGCFRVLDAEPAARAELGRVQEAIHGLDLSATAPLRARLADVEVSRQRALTDEREAERRQHTSEGQREKVDEARADKAENWKAALAELDRAFPEALVAPAWAAYRAAYEAEAARDLKPSTIQRNFREQADDADQQAQELRNLLSRRTTQFGSRWGEVVAGPDDVTPYATQLADLTESRLPEFAEKIAAARMRAEQQIMDDVLAKLGERFRKLRRMIRELNDTLGAFEFGHDCYAFELDPMPEHRRYYDLVMAADSVRQGREAMAASLEASHGFKTALESLLQQLMGARNPAAMQKQVADLSDYRQYFKYDLIISRRDGTKLSWAYDGGDGSGGETQTPFYIAIFASFYRMYRAAEPNRPPKAGIVLLDEAFSQMDPTRIEQAMKLAATMKLQLLIATPRDRATILARHVDTCVYVLRSAQGNVGLYDYTQKLRALADASAGAAA